LKALSVLDQSLLAIKNEMNTLETLLASLSVSTETCSKDNVSDMFEPIINTLERFNTSLVSLQPPIYSEEWVYQGISSKHTEVSHTYSLLSNRLENLQNHYSELSETIYEEALRLRRINVLEKILPRLVRMSLNDFAEYLEFDDFRILKSWLFALPADYPLLLDGEDIVVDRDKIGTSDEINDMIDKLLDKFDIMEQTQTGKID
jgi:hypothetical protein